MRTARPRTWSAIPAAIYRIDPSGAISRLTPGDYGITNTMGWTRDNRFLFADTLANEIYSFAYDPAMNAISDRKTIVSGFGRGFPDGSCLDAGDNLWNCRVAGGASVAQFTARGELLDLVELPVTWPTSCTFGGDDLSTLYVTSARFTMTPEYLAVHPREGSLLAADVGARGRPEPKFGY